MHRITPRRGDKFPQVAETDSPVPERYRVVLHRFDGSMGTFVLENRSQHPYRIGDELAEQYEGKWRVVEIQDAADGTPVLICEQTY